MSEQDKAPKAEKQDKTPKLVKMQKGDREADVHPDEVENYEAGGYHKK